MKARLETVGLFLYAFEEKIYILHNSEKYMFTILYLTQQKKCDIIIKLSHESESQGNLLITGAVKRIGRSTVSGWSCSRKVHLTKCLKCGRMNRLTVLDRLLRKRERKYGVNFSSQNVYLTKSTECDKIEKLVTARSEEKRKHPNFGSQNVYLTKTSECDII